VTLRTLVATLALALPAAAETSALARCLAERELPRVARVRGPDERAHYVRVVAQRDGIPSAVAPIAPGDTELALVLERAGEVDASGEVWEIAGNAGGSHFCSPIALARDEIDAERRVIVAAGLNYAAHAEEAGGGDVFLFPKPVAPSAPYGVVPLPSGEVLLDYEIELGFVLTSEVRLRDLPSREELLAHSAFFVANEISNREPIIREKPLSGTSTGFVEGKGQPGFLPAGPWLVRGRELFAALSACGGEGLGLRLEVDEGAGFVVRQASSSARMILDPHALLVRLAEWVEAHGLRSPMPLRWRGKTRYYPLALDPQAPHLPAGSLLLTGTPDGVALRVPDALALTGRGLLHLRGPIEQFRQEELARAAAGAPGGYLAAGDRVRARIDGLGAQIVRIGPPGAAIPDPCAAP